MRRPNWNLQWKSMNKMFSSLEYLMLFVKNGTNRTNGDLMELKQFWCWWNMMVRKGFEPRELFALTLRRRRRTLIDGPTMLGWSVYVILYLWFCICVFVFVYEKTIWTKGVVRFSLEEKKEDFDRWTNHVGMVRLDPQSLLLAPSQRLKLIARSHTKRRRTDQK